MHITLAHPPQRHDLYSTIHKALRAMLFDTLLRIGRQDADDEPALAQTLAQAEALLAQLSGHIRHENEFVHAALDARCARASSVTADAHIEHLDSIDALAGELAALRLAAPAQREPLLTCLYRHLSLFVAENLQHMQIEESANNAALWQAYSDAELQQIHERLIASIAPAEMAESLGWMMEALNLSELGALMGELRAKLPPPAFAGILELARQRLDERRWRRLALDFSPP